MRSGVAVTTSTRSHDCAPVYLQQGRSNVERVLVVVQEEGDHDRGG